MSVPTTDKVHYLDLLPHEFSRRLEARPVAYLPLGTLEWHGEHLPLGTDAIISEGLMAICARQIGGIVMPLLFLGPDRSRSLDDGVTLYGMDYAEQTNPPRALTGSCYWVPEHFFVSLIDAILGQLKRAGFRGVFADGHGPSRDSWIENLAAREARFGMKLFAAPVRDGGEWRIQRDHAARNETSLVMALRPELANLGLLPTDVSIWPQGVDGDDPRTSDPDHGWECISGAVQAVKVMLESAGL